MDYVAKKLLWSLLYPIRRPVCTAGTVVTIGFVVYWFLPETAQKLRDAEVLGKTVRLWDDITGRSKKKANEVRAAALRTEIAKREAQLSSDKAANAIKLGLVSSDEHGQEGDEMDAGYAAQEFAIGRRKEQLGMLLKGQFAQELEDDTEAEIRASDARLVRQRRRHEVAAELRTIQRDQDAATASAQKVRAAQGAQAAVLALNLEIVRHNTAIRKLEQALKANAFPVAIGTARLTRDQAKETKSDLEEAVRQKSDELERLMAAPQAALPDKPAKVGVNELLGTN